jgi:hypothetical protein
MDTFLEYILEKYYVFDPLAELDESNTIDDIDIIKRRVNTNIKRIDDNSMIDLTKQIFLQFRCFNIEVNFQKSQPLLTDMASIVYNHYKKYKCTSSTSTRETETSLRLDESLDTKKTYYVASLDKVTTDDLKSKFGEYMRTGGKKDDYRYEYRFLFTKGGKKYTFGLYDYKNDDNDFYCDDDIYWHISSNTDKKVIIDAFVKTLEQTLIECC